MKFMITLFITILLSNSCSTLKKQKLMGAAIGSLAMGQIGRNLGETLSPNEESKQFNQTMGLAIGTGIGFLIGNYTAETFWDDKTKNKLPSNLLQEDQDNQQIENQVRILDPKNVKKIELEDELPNFLRGKVKKASVFTYEIEAYEEQTEDDRKIYHEPHKAYEYILE